MSIVKTSSVFCDLQLDGCAGWIGEWSGPEGTTHARREAKQAGWKRWPSPDSGKWEDACPSCIATVLTPKADQL